MCAAQERVNEARMNHEHTLDMVDTLDVQAEERCTQLANELEEYAQALDERDAQLVVGTSRLQDMVRACARTHTRACTGASS